MPNDEVLESVPSSGSSRPATPSRAAVEAALAHVTDPCSTAAGVPITLAEMGLVKRIDIQDGEVLVTLRLTSPVCLQAPGIAAAVESAVNSLGDVRAASCRFDHEWDWAPEMISPDAITRLRRARPFPAGPPD